MKKFEGLGESVRGVGVRFLSLLVPTPEVREKRNQEKIESIKEEIKRRELTASKYAVAIRGIIEGPQKESVAYPYLEELQGGEERKIASLRRLLARLESAVPAAN